VFIFEFRVKTNMFEKTIRAIDLFCGAGGSTYGAITAGVNVVAGFDIWDLAIKAYETNFPKAKTFQRDLRSFSHGEIEGINSSLGKIDLILASPECTNHSKAKGAAERSEESKETAFEAVRFAEVIKPSWIVLENVVEFGTWNRFKDLLEDLWRIGYFVRQISLNSKDFGVPQSRERLFLLCSLSGKTEEPVFRQKKIKPVSSIIDTSGNYGFTPLRKEGRAEYTIKSAERAISELGNSTPFLLVYYGSARKGNSGWQTIDEPLGTITTLDRFAYVVPSKSGHMMRMLQPEELKLAMGFKSNYKLGSIDGLTRRDRIKLMGNGVCPPVMESLVRSLILNGKS
jgi:DNA (cytosine-5)-methyltransferase 1